MNLKPSSLAEALKTCIRIKRPALITGGPGVGKSSIVAQVAKELGYDLIDRRLATMDPVDLRGLPSLDGRHTRWNCPDWVPEPGHKAIILFDELTAAPLSMQVAAYEAILDRRIGGHPIPDDCAMLGAGNGIADGAAATRMSTALTSRFVNLTLEPDLNDWCNWALSNGIEPSIVAFLRFRPELLYKLDRQGPFPCLRTWYFVSEIVKASPHKSVLFPMIEGTIGNSAAVEYYAFLDMWHKLPNIDGLLLNPTSEPIPTDPATLYAVSTALACMAKHNNLRAVMTYTGRMPKEYETLTIKTMMQKTPDLKSTPEFTKWAVGHSTENV